MAAGVVIDTSFLITLADKNRKHHDTARRYWRHFLDSGIPIFLSTVVVSEFYIKQEIPPEMLRCCVVLPFNWDDALRAAKLDWTRARPWYATFLWRRYSRCEGWAVKRGCAPGFRQQPVPAAWHRIEKSQA